MEIIVKQIPFYKTTPPMNSLVIAEVVDFNDDVVTCILPEYCCSEAIIPTKEIKIKRGKAVRNYIQKGKQLVAQVIRVDTLNRVDLSMKIVKEEEEKETFDRYFKTLKVLQIIGATTNYDLEKTRELYIVCQKAAENFTSVYTYFEACLIGESEAPGAESSRCQPEDFSRIFAGAQILVKPLEPPSKELLESIKKRIQSPSYTYEKEVEIRITDANGVENITQILNQWASDGIQVYIISPPKYKLVATANSLVKAKEILDSINVSL